MRHFARKNLRANKSLLLISACEEDEPSKKAFQHIKHMFGITPTLQKLLAIRQARSLSSTRTRTTMQQEGEVGMAGPITTIGGKGTRKCDSCFKVEIEHSF